MVEIMDRRLGSAWHQEVVDHSLEEYVDHTRLLVRQAKQDGLLPGQRLLPEGEERAHLEAMEQQLIQTFHNDLDPTARLEAGTKLARLKELRDA